MWGSRLGSRVSMLGEICGEKFRPHCEQIKHLLVLSLCVQHEMSVWCIACGEVGGCASVSQGCEQIRIHHSGKNRMFYLNLSESIFVLFFSWLKLTEQTLGYKSVEESKSWIIATSKTLKNNHRCCNIFHFPFTSCPSHDMLSILLYYL